MGQHNAPPPGVWRCLPIAFTIGAAMGHGMVHPSEGVPVRLAHSSDDPRYAAHQEGRLTKAVPARFESVGFRMTYR